MTPLPALCLVLLLVAANGFFVATEFAMVSVRRSRIKELVDQGSASASVLYAALLNLDGYIAGTQIGITLASLALGWLGEPAIAQFLMPWLPPAWAHTIAVTIAFCIITFLHVVLGELVPKSVALQRSEQTALRVARPMSWVMILFRPLIWALNGTGNIVLKMLGLHAVSDHSLVHSPQELSLLVRQSHKAGVLDATEERLTKRALRFGDLRVEAIMVPRQDIEALDINAPFAELHQAVLSSGHSRLPVYEGEIDHVVGMLDLQTVLRHFLENPDLSTLRPLVRPVPMVPRSVTLDRMLGLLQKERSEMAIVLDESGGTAGLVTLADAVGEVFAPSLEDVFRRGSQGQLLVPGAIRLEQFNDLLGWDLDNEQVDHLSGFIMNELDRPAREGDVVKCREGQLRVERVSRLRILEVAVLTRDGEAWEGP